MVNKDATAPMARTATMKKLVLNPLHVVSNSRKPSHVVKDAVENVTVIRSE